MSRARRIVSGLIYAAIFPFCIALAVIWIFASLVWTILRSEHQ
jgi:hypothetical protein